MGTKFVLFGEKSSGLMKQKSNCLAIMTIVMFGGNSCFAAGGTGALHKIDGIVRQGKLCGYIVASPQDISQDI